MKLIFKAVFVLILVSSNASAWPTRDHFNAMYQECVAREGGYLTNGIISPFGQISLIYNF